MARNSNDQEERLETIERILGKPVFDEFSENTLRIRRNLLFVGFLVIAYKLNELSVSSEFVAVGFKFEGLTDHGVELTMFLIVLYHLVHFFWNSLNHLQQWRLRITGTVNFDEKDRFWKDEDRDYPSDPRQSTLYNWWLENANRIGNVGRLAHELEMKSLELETGFQGLSDPDVVVNVRTIISSLTEIKKSSQELNLRVEAATKAISSNRIPVSLSRFDKWFKLFQWNQIIRWITIEWLMPIVVGIFACWMTGPF